MLLTTKSFTNSQASRASILMKTGACVGGTIIGWISQSFGRRRSIFVAALLSCCLIPAWILPNTESGLSASGFMLQFFVQGGESEEQTSVDHRFCVSLADLFLSTLSSISSLGSHSSTSHRIGSTSIQSFISRDCLPAWERHIFSFGPDRH